MEIPLAVVERIMRSAGAKSVSEDAVREMQGSAQSIAEEVLVDAATIAQDDGRETVTVEDVERALET